MSTDDRLIWLDSRTRVYVSRTFENPWSRSGDQARSAREFVRGLDADRPEEDEDYEVLAPPRPTRTLTAWREPAISVHSDMLDSDAKAEQDRLAELKRQQREREEMAALDAHRRWLKEPWEYGLDDWDLFDEASALEKIVDRRDGHWFVQTLWMELGGRYLRPAILAWYLQHGEVSSRTVLVKTCKQPSCCSPHHHKEKKR